MATTAMWYRFHMATASTADSTRAATRYERTRRRRPTPGLTASQILNALTELGYGPLVYQEPTTFAARLFLYAYTESEVPVIVGLETPTGRHAITVFGHSLGETGYEVLRKYDTFDALCAWSRVPTFLAHDDQRGPYVELEFRDTTDYVDPKRPHFLDPAKLPRLAGMQIERGRVPRSRLNCPVLLRCRVQETTETLQGNIIYLIVPLPRDVSLAPEQAENKAIRLLRLAMRRARIEQRMPQRVWVRTYLVRATEFKESLESRNPPLARDALTRLQGTPMSRYVWITEFRNAAGPYVDVGGFMDELVFATVVQDASSSGWSDDFVCVHLMGVLISFDPEEFSRRGEIGQIRHAYLHPVKLRRDRQYGGLARSCAPLS